MENKICCMFFDPVPGHAIDNKDLEYLAIDKWSRREESICRCRKCGAFVLYKYEENAIYDWDNVDIDEDYIPIEEPVIENGQFPEDVTPIPGAPTIYARYKESDWKKTIIWNKS